MGSEQPLPFLLFTAHQITGHLTPTLRVAAALHAAGWDLSFLGPTAHRARIERAGVAFYPLQGLADFDDLAYYSASSSPAPGYWQMSWQARALVDFKATWIATIPSEWASFTAALVALHARDPTRDVIVVTEALFFGILPLFLDAPLPNGVRRPRATVALSITVPLLRSADQPPFGFAGGFDTSAEGRVRNAELYEVWERLSAPLKLMLDAKLAEAGAQRPTEQVFATGWNYTVHDRILQLGVPSFFFPRGDWPEKFSFVGVIPAAEEPKGGWPNLPAWWDETVKAADRGRKKIVVVAQGTVEVDPNNLIIPTIEAMKERADVLVVAILGRKRATLPEGFRIPANARVTDYLHYDAILPHAHAWVHNGGYGAVQHGIAHGVPMVTAGEGQDKTENCKRIAWSKAGVDLGTSQATAEEIHRALNTVLDDPVYKERVQIMHRESRELDCFRLVERTVSDLAG